MSFLGWMVGLGIANSVLNSADEAHEKLAKKNSELEERNRSLELEQRRLRERIERLERGAR